MTQYPVGNQSNLGGLIMAVADAHPDWIDAQAVAVFSGSSWAALPVSNIKLGDTDSMPLLTATVGPVDDWAPEYNKTLKIVLKEGNTMADTEISVEAGLVLEVNKKDVTVVLKPSDAEQQKDEPKGTMHFALASKMDMGSVKEMKTWVKDKLGASDEEANFFSDLPEPLDKFKAQAEEAHMVLEEFEITVPPKKEVDGKKVRDPVTFALGLSAQWVDEPLELVEGKLAVKKVGLHIERKVKS